MISFFLLYHYIAIQSPSWFGFRMRTSSLLPRPVSSASGWWLRRGKLLACIPGHLSVLGMDFIPGLTLALFIYLWWALTIWWPHVALGGSWGMIHLYFNPIANWLFTERMATTSLWDPTIVCLPSSLPWILCCFVLCHQESSKAFASFFIHYATSCRNMSAVKIFLRNAMWESHSFLPKYSTPSYKQ